MIRQFKDINKKRRQKMKKIIPERLKKGDEIRVIAPSRSLNVLREEVVENAKKRLEELGLVVTFGKNVMKYESENFKCARIEDRIDDLHDALKFCDLVQNQYNAFCILRLYCKLVEESDLLQELPQRFGTLPVLLPHQE